MLLTITDKAFNAYVHKLYGAINNADAKQLKLLQPSVIMAQRQATTPERTWQVVYLLKHYHSAHTMHQKYQEVLHERH